MNSQHPGQLLLIGVPGPELDSATAAALRRIQPGGFILFGRNIRTPAQLRQLIDNLRDLSAVEPVITIDQEGGRVSRLRLLGSEPPNAVQLRDHGDPDAIRRHGETTGSLLRLFGFNLDLCPVLDISFDDEADNSLRGRCYGRSPDEVIEKAGVFDEALRASGILSCGKHFPGYTHAGLDPHHELPVIPRTRAEMEQCELAVFRHFAGRIDSMMIGHASYPDLDPSGLPASLSPAVIRTLLGEDLGFGGLVMTDDLDMGAILNGFGVEEMIRRAITAGNHMAMICHRIEVVEQALAVLDKMPASDLDAALQAVAKFKTRLAPADPFSEDEFRVRDARVWDLRVEVLGLEKAKERSPEDGKRSPVELY